MKRTHRAPGFTLVELLVVMAVLIVLASLLFAVFARVREKAQRASCQNNLRQIYLALVQYVADADSRFPHRVGWTGALLPYTKNPQVFFCPSVPPGRQLVVATVDPGFDYGYAVGWLNTMSFASGGNGLPLPQLTGSHESILPDILRIPVSADLPFFANSQTEVPLPRGTACGITLSDGTPQERTRASTIHGGGANRLFYDGHIKWQTPVQHAEWECEIGVFLQPPFRADGPHMP